MTPISSISIFHFTVAVFPTFDCDFDSSLEKRGLVFLATLFNDPGGLLQKLQFEPPESL
jgi:hypothetical protein